MSESAELVAQVGRVYDAVDRAVNVARSGQAHKEALKSARRETRQLEALLRKLQGDERP